MKLNQSEIHRAQKYQLAEPKQFGNLHQRMKLVILLMQKERELMPHDLWNAIYDLETEVKYHEPAKPPYARRTQNLNA